MIYSATRARIESPGPGGGSLSDRRKLVVGLLAVGIGLGIALLASMFVHASEAPAVDELGREIYSFVPRGWQVTTLGQIVALGGILVSLAGATLAFVYDRELTWARASIGAFLFTALMLVIFGVIPNQWLTLVQSSLEWTPQKIFITVPPALVLNNEVSVSYAALKDIVSGTYSFVMLIVVAVVMVRWQTRASREPTPKPQPVSSFGRPLRIED